MPIDPIMGFSQPEKAFECLLLAGIVLSNAKQYLKLGELKEAVLDTRRNEDLVTLEGKASLPGPERPYHKKQNPIFPFCFAQCQQAVKEQ